MGTPCGGVGYDEKDGVLAWLPPVGLASMSGDVQIENSFPARRVPFDTVLVEGGLEWQGTPYYQFVVTAAGLYEATLNVVWQEQGADPTGAATATPTGRRVTRIMRNDIIIASKQQDAVGVDDQSVRAGPLLLAVGDVIYSLVYQDCGFTILLKGPQSSGTIPPYGRSQPFVVARSMPTLGLVFRGEADP